LSVFGSTINEAARLETLTKTFATPIVGSEEFTAYCREREALGSESLARGQRSHDRVPVDPDGASDAETVVLLS
jgi:class 3 adenylate cyclase